ncbi:MAG: zinc-ribbon domain-containing protein [Schwartzia succinivorans]|jgi:uncharacterized Zn finger protein (UPF0148 family)|nr:zinc-ribbon domain-containing protein [Schwartzia succinivorans]
MANFCKKCGSPLSPGVKFCAKCGTAATPVMPVQQTEPIQQAVQMQTTSTSAVQNQVAPVSDGGTKKWLIAAGIVLLLAGGGWYYWQGRNEAQNPLVSATATHAPVPSARSDQQSVHDNAALLVSDEREKLERKIKRVEREQGVRIGIVTQSSLQGRPIGQVANALLDQGYRGAENGGIVLLIAMDTKDWYISTDNVMRQRVTDKEGIQSIRQQMVPQLSKGNYHEGFEVYVDVVENLVARYARARSASGTSAQKSASNAAMSSELSLGGICIGNRQSDVQALLGREQKVTNPNKNGHLHYVYPDIEVVMANGTVTGFISNSAKVSTKRGIHEGSTLQEVLRAYGDSTSKFTFGDSTMYEYSFKSMDRKDCLLRFAIKNNRVDYISARVADGK